MGTSIPDERGEADCWPMEGVAFRAMMGASRAQHAYRHGVAMSTDVSSQELALVRFTLEHVNGTQARFASLAQGADGYPIPF